MNAGRIEGEVRIHAPELVSEATIRISHETDRVTYADLFSRVATIVLETGAARVQVYATAQQCRGLAALLTQMADSIDTVPAEAEAEVEVAL